LCSSDCLVSVIPLWVCHTEYISCALLYFGSLDLLCHWTSWFPLGRAHNLTK
jgi:hypothetical protein